MSVASERPGRLVLLGHPVTQSLSPIFQNAALKAAGIPLEYVPLDVAPANLRRTLDELGRVRAAGNITIPHKVAVHDACAVLTPLAEEVGAVNTFWFEDGKLAGDNTDVGGFDAAARALLGDETSNSRVLVLGAGGAAAAVLAAIAQWTGAEAAVVSRNFERAADLARRFPDVARAEKRVDRALQAATLIVNTTPVGQHDDDHPLELDQVPKRAAVFDLVYRRGGTEWVKAARARGLRAADGLPMLLEQGALAFQRWFGVEPDREAMRVSLL
jgi:shikimate dehydrogenase